MCSIVQLIVQLTMHFTAQLTVQLCWWNCFLDRTSASGKFCKDLHNFMLHRPGAAMGFHPTPVKSGKIPVIQGRLERGLYAAFVDPPQSLNSESTLTSSPPV